MLTFFGALARAATESALGRPERYAGSYLWWLVGTAAVVALAWGYLAWGGSRSVLTQRASREEDQAPEDRNPDLR